MNRAVVVGSGDVLKEWDDGLVNWVILRKGSHTQKAYYSMSGAAVVYGMDSNSQTCYQPYGNTISPIDCSVLMKDKTMAPFLPPQ